MCTVTFVPGEIGFLLGMNRDERWTRGAEARPPGLHEFNGVGALYPRDGSGGTWIAINQHGLAFAILNRNHSGSPLPKARSRGELIPMLLPHGSLREAKENARVTKLDGLLPFRLFIFSARERAIGEIVFDGEAASEISHAWARQHWFSSGLSDEEAARHRSAAVLQLKKEAGTGTLDWIRNLHCSHFAGEAFSICVHRELVGSVSYTEIELRTSLATMRYVPGPPCKRIAPVEASIKLDQFSSR